ncbi:MAG: AmmeMemoRadiSam system protein B, partial [Candidatus Micrarchaeia archaeon]
MRYPSVAGTFYPSDKNELNKILDSFFNETKKEVANLKKEINEIIGIISPHAGYIYSGKTAAYGYSLLEGLQNFTFIILGPNHTGMGKLVAISREEWMTPLGKVGNDTEIGKIIEENSEFAEFDETAHFYEHSIEVQLPFLQKVVKDPKAVEICIGMQTIEIVEDISNSLKNIKKNFCIIASSDFTHFESSKDARKYDEKAMDYILNLDWEGFMEFAETGSICGYGPIGILTKYAKEEKCKVKLLKYSNSGDVTGDYSSVVGYA